MSKSPRNRPRSLPAGTYDLLAKYLPKAMDGFFVMRENILAPPPSGAIPVKYKELIVLALQAALRLSPNNVVFHAATAMKHGATPKEVAEALALSIWLVGASTYITSGSKALEIAEQIAAGADPDEVIANRHKR